MHTTLWIVQGLLGIIFLMVGILKLMQEKEKLKSTVGGWVEGFSSGELKTIGMLEVLGGFGLVLPMLLDIMPVLTPVAATGLAATMIGGALTHLKRSEMKNVGVNVILMLLAVFVAVGRFMIEPVV